MKWAISFYVVHRRMRDAFVSQPANRNAGVAPTRDSRYSVFFFGWSLRSPFVCQFVEISRQQPYNVARESHSRCHKRSLV